MTAILDTLRLLMEEEARHVDSLPSGSDAARRFATRRDALNEAIVVVEAAVKYRVSYGSIALLRSCGDSAKRIEFFEAVDRLLAAEG